MTELQIVSIFITFWFKMGSYTYSQFYMVPPIPPMRGKNKTSSAKVLVYLCKIDNFKNVKTMNELY